MHELVTINDVQSAIESYIDVQVSHNHRTKPTKTSRERVNNLRRTAHTVDPHYLEVQETRDSRTSAYQICRIEGKKINRTTTFQKWINNLTPEVGYIRIYLWNVVVRFIFSSVENIVEKRRNSSLFHNILLPVLNFHVKTWTKGTRFSLRDKRLFEISGVDTQRVDCMYQTNERQIN